MARKTIRDEFAMAAMQSIILTGALETKKLIACEHVANLAYIFADAMMAQREEETVDNRTKEEE